MPEQGEPKTATEEKVAEPIEIPMPLPPCTLEDSMVAQGLVKLDDINADIRTNLRYSDTNNFLHLDLYDCLETAYMQAEAAKMLSNAQNLLTEHDSSLHLLVWDATRPRSVQWKMWNALKMPLAQKVRFVSNPRNGSIHNFGCAVDLTICDEGNIPLDMGTDFDYFGRAASTRYEAGLVAEGLITQAQLDNRKLLRLVMKQAGFTTISSEWWHYNAMSRSIARAKYAIVE